MRFRGLMRWMTVDATPFWLSTLVPAASLACTFFFPFKSELNVRVAGYVLTVAGIILAIKGILEKGLIFQRPSFTQRVAKWVGRFPTFFRKPVSHSLSLEASAIATSSASAYMTFSAGPDASMEQRVRALERNLEILGERIEEAQRRFAKEAGEYRLRQGEELDRIKRDHGQLTMRLEKLAVGGLDVEFAAVIWVLFGNLFTTFPVEVAMLLPK